MEKVINRGLQYLRDIHAKSTPNQVDRPFSFINFRYIDQ